MSKLIKTLDNKQKKDVVSLVKVINEVPTLQIGGTAHKHAKERLLYLLMQDQEKVARALIRKAKSGDVRAIVEFFDRLYGKSKETIDVQGDVKFSLIDLARRRDQLSIESRVIDTVLESNADHNVLSVGVEGNSGEDKDVNGDNVSDKSVFNDDSESIYGHVDPVVHRGRYEKNPDSVDDLVW